MRTSLCGFACLMLAACTAHAQKIHANDYVVIRTQEADEAVSYQVVSAKRYAERVNESQLQAVAMDRAYNEIKSEWTQARKDESERAIRNNREEARRRNVDVPFGHRDRGRNSRSRRQALTTRSFPLSRPPPVRHVKFVATYRTERAANSRLAECQAKESRHLEKNEALLRMRSKSRLEGPAQSKDPEASSIKTEVEERAKMIFEKLLADSNASGAQGGVLGSPGLSRPSQADKGAKRVGDGLKSMKFE